MRKIERTKNRDDDIADIVSLRAEANPDVRSHYEGREKGSPVGLCERQAPLDG